MTIKAEQLIQLAESRFSLYVPELKLLRKVADGEDADYQTDEDALNEPANSAEWDQNRTLPVSLIIWLCTDPEACPFITHRGLSIVGAKIEGSLNLQYASLEFPLIFRRCAFTEVIRLERAKVKLLDLSGSYVASSQISDFAETWVTSALEARGIKVESDILLRNEFKATGRILLNDATIGGNLACDKGAFENSGGDALSAQSAEIKGDVLLSDDFTATGQVSLNGATIGGSLQCNNGAFENSGGDALNAHSAEIKGNVLLSNRFTAAGQVFFFGATIGGSLHCNNGVFDNPKGDALVAMSAEIKGNVLLSNGFKATGQVSLPSVIIGGNLICNDSVFDNPKGYALIAINAEIKGGVFLSAGFKSTGQVSMLGATIGGSLECNAGVFDNPKGDALIAENAEIKGSVFLSAGFKSTGQVSISGVTIGGNLVCIEGVFDNPKGNALIAENAEIKGSIFLRKGFKSTGQVSMLGATIGGNLECDDGVFNNSEGTALNVTSAEIKGNVLLHNGFKAKGVVSFQNSTIDDVFELQGVRDRDEMSLDLRFARIGTLADQVDSWPKGSNLFLDGLVYDKIDRNSPSDGKSRLEWLRRQPSRAFSPQPYEQLAQVLLASGHEEAAAEVLIGKQDDRRRYGGLNWIGWFWNRFLGITIAHGYKPERALWASLGIIGFGIIPFHRGYTTGILEPSDLEAYSVASENSSSSESAVTALKSEPQIVKMSPAYPEFFSPVYSIDVFLPIIDFHQESYWIPKASRGGELFEIPIILLKVQSGGVLLAYFWLHIALGWVFTSLWVAGFTGLVRSVE